ncbi:proline-rich protein 36 [Scomber japonicus]|uniref:proline-rich protein 36 n=1 Tax=Scomber japonicus TaxID=13676 RepID=UPI002304DF6F|nr:proline-rich protein 36 [Scomber japonicus]
MKRGTLNFLGRKNQSLFDTNIKIKDMDNVELVLGSSAIPESGTASVRARPTVKHHTSSSESFQGFAVPTPKVPLLPTVNGLKTNGLVSGDRLSNGSVISVPDLVEGEIFVPPRPSVAPPPPPGTFIPPPPDFMGDLNSLDLATLQPPSMPAPLAPSMEEDLTALKPPPMAPPKPPSTSSNSSASSVPISSPPPVPDHPKFAPPQPPNERQQKTSKTPPPKPIRLSSISILDSPPQTPAPPPPVQTPTQSTFNPQNTAKLYNVPQPSLLSGYEDRDTRPKQILLLEDSGSVTSTPVHVKVDGKAPKLAPAPKPISKDVPDIKENLQITPAPQSPLPGPKKEATTGTLSAQQKTEKPLQTPHQTSPQLQKLNITQVNSGASKGKLNESPSQIRKISPLLDRKLRSLKSSETSGAREGPATSPLALLMAAKQREKQRLSLSRENSTKNTEQPCTSIHQSDSSPNSFIVTPRSSSPSSLTSSERTQESPKFVRPEERTQTIQTTEKSNSTTLIKNQLPSTSPALRRTAEATPSSASNLVVKKLHPEQSLPKSQFPQCENKKEELCVPLLPPPPEFDDFDEIIEPPPSIRPPDPPVPAESSLPPAHVPPPPPKPNIPNPPAPPKLPPPDVHVKPKLQVQPKPQVSPTQQPSTLSPSQATLLSILQKKMLEMDHRLIPMKDADSSSDDWGASVSNEENKVPVLPRATPQTKNFTVAKKTPTLNTQELEDKVVKKYQEASSKKATTSNGLQSKHQYGMTFTVRPGTKQPITLVSKGES